jgi:hypothetical protein
MRRDVDFIPDATNQQQSSTKRKPNRIVQLQHVFPTNQLFRLLRDKNRSVRHLSTEQKYYSNNLNFGVTNSKLEYKSLNQATIDEEIAFDFVILTKKKLNLLQKKLLKKLIFTKFSESIINKKE